MQESEIDPSGPARPLPVRVADGDAEYVGAVSALFSPLHTLVPSPSLAHLTNHPRLDTSSSLYCLPSLATPPLLILAKHTSLPRSIKWGPIWAHEWSGGA
jgi:hypothetical protein